MPRGAAWALVPAAGSRERETLGLRGDARGSSGPRCGWDGLVGGVARAVSHRPAGQRGVWGALLSREPFGWRTSPAAQGISSWRPVTVTVLKHQTDGGGGGRSQHRAGRKGCSTGRDSVTVFVAHKFFPGWRRRWCWGVCVCVCVGVGGVFAELPRCKAEHPWEVSKRFVY